jgi:hypothetical protein
VKVGVWCVASASTVVPVFVNKTRKISTRGGQQYSHALRSKRRSGSREAQSSERVKFTKKISVYIYIKHLAYVSVRYKYRVFQKELYSFEAYIHYSEEVYSVLNCHNEAKHTEIYLR